MMGTTTLNDSRFWQALEELVTTSDLQIDRPRGSAHPRYPEFIYPLDYGYLADTRGPDGSGVDVWVGSLPNRKVTGVVCNVDLVKRDAEVKILLGCTRDEARLILGVHNEDGQSAVLLERMPNDS